MRKYLRGMGLGKFTINQELFFTSDPNNILRIFTFVIPVGIDVDFPNDLIHYTAYSPMFDEIEETDPIPTYEFWFNSRNRSITVKKQLTKDQLKEKMNHGK